MDKYLLEPYNTNIGLNGIDDSNLFIENSEIICRLNNEELIKEEIDKNLKTIPKIISPILTRENINPTNALDALLLILTPELCEYIATQTIDYAKEKYNTNMFIDGEEILNYLMIFIYLSVIDLPEIDWLWDKSEYYSTIIPKLMSRTRFREISKNFHASENANFPKDKSSESINKIKKVVDYFNQKWKENYKNSEYITVDECMASFKGRIHFRQTIKSKRKFVGVKFFAKANSLNGYMYTVIPYTGKTYEYDKSLGCGPSALIQLIEEHKFQNTHITFDNYYSSIDILNYCHLNKILFTCTWLQDRKGFPEILRKKKLKRFEMECYNIKNTNIRYLIFFDNKQVHLASNKYTANMIQYSNKRNHIKNKPEMIGYYNLFHSGVDMVDQICNIYGTQRKFYKWWKSVFFYLFDISILNSSIIYYERNKSNNNSKMLHFRKALYEIRFQKYLLPREPIIEKEINLFLEEKNKNEKIHYPIIGNIKECRECQKDRIKNQKHVSRTKYLCGICKVNLCIKCFADYHSEIYN